MFKKKWNPTAASSQEHSVQAQQNRCELCCERVSRRVHERTKETDRKTRVEVEIKGLTEAIEKISNLNQDDVVTRYTLTGYQSFC